jgi:hypothetical protein
MLFLFSPGGMGIAPIIKPSVVSRTHVLLLFLPRLHGFGTNESQIAHNLHHGGELFLTCGMHGHP